METKVRVRKRRKTMAKAKRVALVETDESGFPFCRWGGLVEIPPGMSSSDMHAAYKEWQASDSGDVFVDWLIANRGCKELDCGWAIVGE